MMSHFSRHDRGGRTGEVLEPEGHEEGDWRPVVSYPRFVSLTGCPFGVENRKVYVFFVFLFFFIL